MSRTLLCAGLALLAACGQDSAAPAAVAAMAVEPADPKLAKLYAQTCKACHTTPGSGAPLTGDVAAWQPRAAQGMPALIEHTVNGYKGMPPLGSCMDCGEKEFEALIRFMAGLGPA
ncbi:MAG: c-type cytochrome [Nevskiaceae bacterium]